MFLISPITSYQSANLVDYLNCVVLLSPTHVVLQELNTGRVIGVGKRSEGLYRLKQGEESLNQRVCVAETPELELFLLHCRLGHIPLGCLESCTPSCTRGITRLN
jgi:hypothetical protein